MVLEHHEGVEEFAAAREPLDVGEAEVLVVEERRVLVLDAPEQFGEGFAGAQADADGDGVDEEAHGLVQARDLGGATGDGGAEDDVPAAGQTAEEQRPGAVEDGARSEALAAGAGGQLGGEGLGQAHVDALGPGARGRRAVPVGGPGEEGQPGRSLQSGQCLAPGVPGGVAVARGQPGQVGARVGGRGRVSPRTRRSVRAAGR